MNYLDRYSVAALGGDDSVVSVVVDDVIVDRQEVGVIVGVEAVPGVVMHLVSAPVSLLVAVRVQAKAVVVDVRVVHVAVHIHLIEDFGVALVHAEPSDLSKTKKKFAGRKYVKHRVDVERGGRYGEAQNMDLKNLFF